jgi:hypothetical protein
VEDGLVDTDRGVRELLLMQELVMVMGVLEIGMVDTDRGVRK